MKIRQFLICLLSGILVILTPSAVSASAEEPEAVAYRHYYGDWLVELLPPGTFVSLVDPEGTLRQGASGDEVEELQQLLVDQGYLDHYNKDGSFGTYTEEAVRRFQEDNGFIADGVAWPQIIELLRHEFSDWEVLQEPDYYTVGVKEHTCVKCGFKETETIGEKVNPGDYGPGVVSLQEALIQLGYPIAADGDYGSDTTRAVRKFQEENGLEADGTAWPGVMDLLYQKAYPEEYAEAQKQSDESPENEAGKKTETEPEEVYTGVWDLQMVELSGRVVPSAYYDLNMSLDLHEDHTALITLMDVTRRGTWQAEDDELTITVDDEDNLFKLTEIGLFALQDDIGMYLQQRENEE